MAGSVDSSTATGRHGNKNHHDKSPVTLMPFLHQVGGHTGVLKYDDSTVCKPLNQSELMFYQSLPEDMVQFVPEFRGEWLD